MRGRSTTRMYKFMHFSDTHLGRKKPSEISQERAESSIAALEHCVQKAIEEDVDFIIHAGDVFDTVYPWHSVIEKAQKALEPLQDEQVPMYVIRGNHDRSYGRDRNVKGLAIDHLENDCIKLIDPSPKEFNEEGFIDHDENIRVHGLGYYSKKTPEVLEDFEPENGRFNILLLHDFIDGVTRTYSDDVAKAKEIAEKDLDYVAIGHDHQPNPGTRINGTVFAATGGTIDYDFNTTEFEKCYNIVKVDEDHEVDLETREIPQELELRNVMISMEDAAIDPIRRRVEQMRNGSKMALKIRITGTAEGDPSEIPTQEIERSIEEEFEEILMAEMILDLKIEEYNDEEEVMDQKFSLEEYLDENLPDNEAESMAELHELADAMMANDENLTPSGFNLDKEARQDLQKKAERQLFGDQD